MRAIVVLLAAIGVGIAGGALAASFPGEPTGFRGIDWGTRFDAVRGAFVFVEKEGDLSRYRRVNEKMSIGEATLDFVGYEFYKGRFKGVVIVSDKGSDSAMIQTFAAQFGPGYKSNPYIDGYLWVGTQTTIWLECDVSRTCSAELSSLVLDREYERDRREAARNAGKDF